MATQTPNYNLTKPDSTEAVDIAVINGNMDKIDAQLKTNATSISSLSKVNIYSRITFNTGGKFINGFYDHYPALKLLHIGFTYTSNSGMTSTNILTVPADLSPRVAVYQSLAVGSPEGYCVMGTDGKLMGYTTVANTTWRVNILIPLP